SPNFNMRDPAIYRIKHATHHRTGDKWCIYPMYDFAHPLEDAHECITHSLCSLEFEDHRPLYDWVINNCDVPCRSRQIEFARLNITNTVMSKRYLRELVETGVVSGWDDPRMPTLCGMRRRGYPAAAIRQFCADIGVAKSNSMVEYAKLEACVRDELNKTAQRRMAVVDPIKVVITNYEGSELVEAENNPEDESAGSRQMTFSGTVYISGEDFMEEPVKGFKRLVPDGDVRLKGAYIIHCDQVVKNADGSVAELRCTYDPTTRSGNDTSGRKVKGTIQWVDAATAVPAKLRYYGLLFDKENMNDLPEGKVYADYLNPDSLEVKDALLEADLANAQPGEPYQFMRIAYFTKDKDSRDGNIIFNRVVTMKEGFKKK
ncbi:MAG: glutamine--tRNA ligase, partial [Firmicutes bacterium]|nr:glutamine--tRNA ligase [Bacillota bacterium]